MADPRGLFVNPNNRGFGTVLGPGAKDYFDYALLGQQAKQKAAADKAAADQKRKDKFDENVMKMLKPLDTYKIYQDAANSKLNEAIDLYEKGQLEYPDLLRYTADYHNLVTKGKELQSNDENAYKNAVQNKRINEDAWVQMRNETLLKDQTIDGLQRRIQNPDNGMVFYQNEVGGSRALNEQTVVKEAIDVLGQQTMKYTVDGDVTWLKGRKILGADTVAREFNNAFEEDAATGEYRVKDVAKLRELGVIRSLMNDKDFSRIVMDKIILEDGFSQDDLDSMGVDDKNRLIDAKVAEVLQPYAGGKSEKTDATKSYTYSTAKDDDEKEDGLREWHSDVKSGDKVLIENALNYLTQPQVSYDGATLKKFLRRDKLQRTNISQIKSEYDYKITSVSAIPDQDIAIATIEPTPDSIEKYGIEPENTRSGKTMEQVIVLPINEATNDPEIWNTLYNPAKLKANRDYDRNRPAGTLDGSFNNNDPINAMGKNDPAGILNQ